MLQDQNTKEKYEKERRECRHIIQRKKRKFLNGILEEAERNRSHGNKFLHDHQETSTLQSKLKSD
jgi:hypothetical protein